MSSNKCSKGKIYRKGYTRRVGSKSVKVSGKCIKSTSQSGLKRTVIDKQYFMERAKRQSKAEKLTKGKSKKYKAAESN